MQALDLHPLRAPCGAATTPPQGRQQRWRGTAAAVALALWLAACGGGGGGGGSPADQVAGPPATAATLGTSATDATQAVQAVLAATVGAANQGAALANVRSLLEAPITRGPGSPVAGRETVQAAPVRDVQPQAVRTAGCVEVVDVPCTGSVVVDTNVPDNATTLQPGNYVAFTFQGLAGGLQGDPVVFNGGLRVDFLSAFAQGSGSLDGTDLVITTSNLSGTVGGVSFGPLNEAARLQVAANGPIVITAGGRRYTNMNSVNFVGSDTYAISNVVIRGAYWGDSSRYIDLDLSSWSVSAGRPVIGSSGRVQAGEQTITIVVVSTSADTVAYNVQMFFAGGSGGYTVTATYPAGGGAPSYSTVAAD